MKNLRRGRRLAAAGLLVLAWAGAASLTMAAADPRAAGARVEKNVAADLPAPGLGRIRHVFILMLENENAAVTFGGNPPSSYLARTLPAEGAFLPNYYGIGHASLDNYIALISGQAPNQGTQLDCPMFSDFQPSRPGLDTHGQLPGVGCVYPNLVKTLPDQLEAAHLTWKGYMEDMGKERGRERATCGHPAVGTEDKTLIATGTDKYAAKHNPFVYFHSIIDDQARCDAHVVNLDVLPGDLQQAATTPNYAFITPNLCNDGHDPECIDGSAGGFNAVDVFLRTWVPLIINSPAFKQDGLLIVTFDESAGNGPEGATACCGELPLPGARRPAGVIGPGGGRIGAVLLSPFIKAGTVSNEPYNHYSLLRTVEDIYGLAHLGYAAEPELKPFGADVFTR